MWLLNVLISCRSSESIKSTHVSKTSSLSSMFKTSLPFVKMSAMLLLLPSHFSHVDSVQPHRWQRTRLPCSWDSPGKNAGVGCHFLLQCMKVKSESEVTQLYLTLHNSMDCSLPGSSVHGIFQARVLEWGAMAFSNACYRVTIINTFIIDMETLGEARYIIVNKW